MIDLSKPHTWPEHLPVTEVGFAGRVAPSHSLDHGSDMIKPEDWGDDYDRVMNRFKPVSHPSEVYRFGLAQNTEGWAEWHHMPKVDVPLHHVFATQPTVTSEHLKRYLANPGDETDHTRKMREAGSPEKAARYPFNDHPGFVHYRGRMLALDGHHRIAAAMMRGDRSIRGKVWDADVHGLRDPLANGWEGYDGG